jgi:hypothetical protein
MAPECPQSPLFSGPYSPSMSPEHNRSPGESPRYVRNLFFVRFLDGGAHRYFSAFGMTLVTFSLDA